MADRLRAVPQIPLHTLKRVIPLAMLNMIAHAGAVISILSSSISFTHIIKSLEPLVSAALTALLLGQYFHWSVYLSLLPIIAGVALVSMHEVSFSWTAFNGATASSVTTVVRNIYSKNLMEIKSLSAANIYAVLTVIGFVVLGPLALVKEWDMIMGLVKGKETEVDQYKKHTVITKALQVLLLCSAPLTSPTFTFASCLCFTSTTRSVTTRR